MTHSKELERAVRTHALACAAESRAQDRASRTGTRAAYEALARAKAKRIGLEQALDALRTREAKGG